MNSCFFFGKRLTSCDVLSTCDLAMVESRKNANSGYFNYAKNFTFNVAGAVTSMRLGNGKWESTTFNSRLQPTQIARQSAYSSDTATLFESVFFEYTDASGMSQKTTDRFGTPVAYGDGGEGSPVEADPMGSNAGTSTPYVEPIQYNPDPDYPNLLLFYDDAPQYVNGQRLTCTLDGMSVGCGQAMSMLNNGSALPAARGTAGQPLNGQPFKFLSASNYGEMLVCAFISPFRGYRTRRFF